MHINCCAGIAQCTLKLRAPITQSTELSRSISGPSSGFGAPIEGRQSDSDGVRPLSRRGPTGLYRTRFGEMKKIPRIRFPLHFFLSAFLDCLDAGAAGAPTLARSHVTLKLREKGLSKSAAKKPLFIAAIQAIDKRGERERLFPWSEDIQMRIAIYARVSTDDKGQDPENQLRQLRQWCATAAHEIAHEYIDRESGRKGAKDRKQFAALFEDAHKRKFDCVLFWALDRFTREGMVP